LRILVQRVLRAAVRVDGRTVGQIGPGLLALVGVRQGDTAAEADWLGAKLPHLRVFEGADGKFERSVSETGGAVLVVSQFTLYGTLRKGRRPDFGLAARPELAEELYERVVQAVRSQGVPVSTGLFAARMDVDLVNDGPVTIMLEREARRPAGEREADA
jgi:D-tyrosyl-tRNA(Tyr) deacylase